MYKQIQNTYQKGLNRDFSPSKQDGTSYYDMLNFRVTTDEGLSTLAIETEKGNKKILSIPDLGGFYKILCDVVLDILGKDIVSTDFIYHLPHLQCRCRYEDFLLSTLPLSTLPSCRAHQGIVLACAIAPTPAVKTLMNARPF